MSVAFMTKDEVAKYLRVHPRTVERWLKYGLLKAHKLGRGKTSLWRIPNTEVKIFLKKGLNKRKK
ncbi:MAG: hypothetical protein A2542_03435 [Parcubacteria group bacterium RIFOXYD2_FULL_52_8]|nr:MAG: hypothetical protein A2542_03435 [Parcubacteria group bacterium RIFOXYD2_FULL_52_8]